MSLVEESVEPFPSPSNANVKLRVKGLGEASETNEGNAGEVAALDLRDERSRDANDCSGIGPPEGSSQAKRSKAAADSSTIHRSKLWSVAVTRGSSAMSITPPRLPARQGHPPGGQHAVVRSAAC